MNLRKIDKFQMDESIRLALKEDITSEDISTNAIYKNSRLAEISLYSKEEGILGGISTGASLAAIAKKLGEIPQNATVLTINYDTGERYWSVDGLFEENIISE